MSELLGRGFVFLFDAFALITGKSQSGFQSRNKHLPPLFGGLAISVISYSEHFPFPWTPNYAGWITTINPFAWSSWKAFAAVSFDTPMHSVACLTLSDIFLLLLALSTFHLIYCNVSFSTFLRGFAACSQHVIDWHCVFTCRAWGAAGFLFSWKTLFWFTAIGVWNLIWSWHL